MVRRSALLQAVPGLAHALTTRRGPDGASLDLGAGASPAAWAWVATQAGLPGAPVALLSQVHGAGVCVATGPGLQGEGDAVITRQPGLLLAVRVADCVPVLVVDLDERGRPVQVAAIHAGWRGLVAGVIPAALGAMGPTGGRRLAVVGPCIGADAYEVGAEVVEGLGSRVPLQIFLQPGRRAGRWQADLRAAAAWQLRQGGVVESELRPDCTFSDPDLHSHRRDGAASGRIAAVVGFVAGTPC